jgi:cobalt-zinc-cadmium efflux system membrane fusion protein
MNVQGLRNMALAAFAAAALAACGQAVEQTAAAKPLVENQTVSFPAGSPQLAALRVAAAEPRRDTLLRLNGRLVWDEDRTARVFTPFVGKVLSIAARAGERVGAGQTLAVIAAPELGLAQAEARKAAEDLVLARKNTARLREMGEAGVAPVKELQAAQAELARSETEVARTQARLKAYGEAAGAATQPVDQRYALRSPIAGVVVERNLNPGQELRPDAAPPTGLFVVSDPSRLWFMLDVAESDVGALKVGAEARLAATALGEDRASGRITWIADQVDPQTRTVKVRGSVANPDRRLKAEMFVTAEVRVPAPHGLTVPADAVYLRGEQYYVFRETGEGRFTRIAVRLGPAIDRQQVVLEGLAVGDKVVIDGALLLDRLFPAKD